MSPIDDRNDGCGSDRESIHESRDRRKRWERLLESLAELDEHPGERDPSPMIPADDLLAAYRAGRLPEEEARRLEAHLGRSSAARARLARLAGVASSAPTTATRKRTLEALREALRRPPRHGSSGETPVWRPVWRWAAAAVLAVTVGALLAWPGGDPATPPDTPLPEIHASIHGLANVRSAPAGPPSRQAVAAPETRVEITAILEPPRAGLEVALYAFHGDRETLERLPAVAHWENRSTAIFQAPAIELVGPEPGVHRLFVVVGREGRLPEKARPESGRTTTETLAAGPGIRVEPLTLEIAPERPSETGIPGSFREEANHR